MASISVNVAWLAWEVYVTTTTNVVRQKQVQIFGVRRIIVLNVYKCCFVILNGKLNENNNEIDLYGSLLAI